MPFTANRIGLLLCGRPLTALRALAGLLKDGGTGEEAPSTAQKREQMRASSAMRELVAFMLTDEYASLAEGA